VESNKHLILPGETDWAFGQVLSLVMIVASLNEVLKFVIARVRRWRAGYVHGDDRAHIDLEPELAIMRHHSYDTA